MIETYKNLNQHYIEQDYNKEIELTSALEKVRAKSECSECR